MKQMMQCGLMALTVLWLLSCRQSDKAPARSTETAGAILLSDTANKAATVFLTTDERENPVVSWTEEDSAGNKKFYFARWNAEEKKFERRMEIPMPQNVSIHEEGMPKIAIKGDGALMAFYEVSVPQPGKKWGVGDIVYIQSGDQGRSWSTPASVNIRKTADASLSFSGICRLADGEIGVSWLDANQDGADQPGRPVMFARTSTGRGFGEPVLVEKIACECCRVAVAAGKGGNVGIAYRDLQPGNIRDISFSASFDQGHTFRSPRDFSGDEWEINGCPHNGPSIVSGKDRIYAVWYSGGQKAGVHYAELDTKGELIHKEYLSRNARFAQIALLPAGSRIVAYNENYQDADSVYSRIVLNKINKDGLFTEKIISPGKHGNFPVVQAAGTDYVVLAWRDSDRIYWKLTHATDINQRPETAGLVPEIAPLKGMEGMHDMAH